MKTTFKISDLIDSISERMESELREKLVPTPSELGTGREEIIRVFLRKYLPKRFEVSTGFVFDCHHNLSKQMDIIIYDNIVCPQFEVSGGKRFFPCESVVAVGEVKTSISSRKELSHALKNLESVKILDRSGNNRAISFYNNSQIDQKNNHLDQIFTFLFITERSLASDTFIQSLIEYLVDLERYLWPNITFFYGQYLISFCCDDGFCPNPMHAKGVAIKENKNNDNLLLRFYLTLARAIEVTSVARFNYWEYLEGYKPWDSEVYLFDIDSPPTWVNQSK